MASLQFQPAHNRRMFKWKISDNEKKYQQQTLDKRINSEFKKSRNGQSFLQVRLGSCTGSETINGFVFFKNALYGN